MTSELVSNLQVVAAPHEGNLSTEHAWTDVFDVVCHSCSMPFDVLLKDYLPGVGRADLVKIEANITTTAAKQHVYVGFCSTLQTLTAKQAGGRSSGIRFITNDKTYGAQITKVLVPDDTFSLQIRPNSAMLTMLNFLVDISEDVDVTFTFYVKVHGVRRTYIDLN